MLRGLEALGDSSICTCSMPFMSRKMVLRSMIEILRFLKDPKLWELWYLILIMGNARFISGHEVVVQQTLQSAGSGQS